MKRTLLLDIGSGTQDVLYFMPERKLLNCPKFVLPSPARMVGERIEALAGKPLWLHGSNMGGGFARTLRKHLAEGGTAASTSGAAYSLGDDLDRVQSMGVTLSDTCPEGHVPVLLTDFDAAWWDRLLQAAELPLPEMVAACAQDHGFHKDESNRRGRFRLWERFLLEAGGDPKALIYQTPPPELTRLADLQASIGGGPVADTGAAAVLGALFVPEIAALSRKRGITVVNLGNSHTVAFLIYAGRILGVYEHHTGLYSTEKLQSQLNLFRAGRLAFELVFDDRGHGCLTLDLPAEAGDFSPTFVLGPRREMLEQADVTFPAPGGDMMLAGSFGLLGGLGYEP